MNSDKNTNLIWIDLEMTGLDVDKCVIIEIATVITNQDLEIIAEGPDLIINRTQSQLDIMDEWNRQHHGDSGLTQAVIESTISHQQAEQQTLAFIKQYVNPQASPLCGNTVYTDKHFLDHHMPSINNYLHYRSIDVSSIKTLYQRWRPEASMFEKAEKHRALDDIKESIQELKFYRDHGFIG